MVYKPTQAELKREIEEEIKLAGEMYRKLDANDDHAVTKAELVTGLKDRQQHLTSANKDLLCQFYSNLLQNFDQADRNDDASLSFVEFILYFDKLKEKFIQGVA